jgi:hypothetical protein
MVFFSCKEKEKKRKKKINNCRRQYNHLSMEEEAVEHPRKWRKAIFDH